MRNYVLGFVALALAGCATPNPPVAVPTLTKDARATQMDEKSTPASPPTGQQWLYGSAEGSIASAQVYTAMTDYVWVRRRTGLRAALLSMKIYW
jgi:hypothetical protein